MALRRQFPFSVTSRPCPPLPLLVTSLPLHSVSNVSPIHSPAAGLLHVLFLLTVMLLPDFFHYFILPLLSDLSLSLQGSPPRLRIHWVLLIWISVSLTWWCPDTCHLSMLDYDFFGYTNLVSAISRFSFSYDCLIAQSASVQKHWTLVRMNDLHVRLMFCLVFTTIPQSCNASAL